MSTAELIFLGTGTSEGVPRVSCLVAEPVTCRTCLDAVVPGSKNRRQNTSLAIRFSEHGGGETKTLIIDVGKFFRQSELEWFPKYKIRKPDAVVLTHSHVDAAGGLDDLREWTNTLRVPIPVYARGEDLEVLSKTVYYLINRSSTHSAGTLARLNFIEIGQEPFHPLPGIKLEPLQVEHGRKFTSNGYRFGDICYIPDVSYFPPETWKKMQGCRLLVVDALRWSKTYGSHLTIEQAIEVTARLKPESALFVGISHEAEHHATNTKLRQLGREGVNASLAYDGLRLEIDI